MLSTTCPPPVSSLLSHSVSPFFNQLVSNLSNLQLATMQAETQGSDTMASPAKTRSPHSTDSSNTEHCSVFDSDDPPLSSSGSECEDATFKMPPRVQESTEQTVTDADYGGTAASRRPQRKKNSQGWTPFHYPTPPKTVKKPKVQNTDDTGSEQAPSTAKDVQSSASSRQSPRKRTLEAPYEGSSTPHKKTNKATAKNKIKKQAFDTAEYVEGPTSPPPTSAKCTIRQHKRKAQAGHSYATPSRKKAKTVSTKAISLSQSGTKSATTDTSSSQRIEPSSSGPPSDATSERAQGVVGHIVSHCGSC
jgi:hypothetical protein